MAENKGNTADRPKKWSKRIPHYMISVVLDVPESTVKAIRNGQRSDETPTGEKIQVAEILLDEGLNKLLQETKRIVQFK